MKLTLTIIASALALMPLTGRTDGLSYTYWQASYVGADIDGIDPNLDGYGLYGSFELTKEVFLYAGYSDISASIYGYDLSEQDITVGLGYAWSLMKNLDLVGRAGYAGAKAHIDDYGSASESGYTVSVGLRGRPADRLELEGGVGYVDFPNAGSNTSVGVGVQWYFTDQVAIALSGAYSNDATTYGIGLRGTWGRTSSR